MKIEILTLFPSLFESFLTTSLIKKAVERNLLQVTTTNIRDFADPPHFQVDDTPYGGGAGMVMKPEPLYRAIEAARSRLPKAPVILFTPSGAQFSQKRAQHLSAFEELILICGRYEAIDERVIELAVDEELSIGDYVLMGGELPAMVVIEATIRLRENVLGNSDSLSQESFGDPLTPRLEAPHYTRPQEFQGKQVPEVLLSGNHKEIEKWRAHESLIRTRTRRPDILRNE